MGGVTVIVRFCCNTDRLKELHEIVESELTYMMSNGTFVDQGTGMTITPEMIDKGFKLIAPDTLFEDDTLPEIITGFMDKAVYARGFYDNHEIIEPVDNEKRPVLIRPNP